jgi:hypothetical protein
MKNKYQVIVGNIGTVHEGNNRVVALNCFHEYRLLSISESGRACGESVTLMSNGEPIQEHEGWMQLFHNYSEDETRYLLSTRRREDRKDKCPHCDGTPVGSGNEVKTETYDDGKDVRYKKRMSCGSCGLIWYDILRIVGIEVVSGGTRSE